jgi:hypothetical protein
MPQRNCPGCGCGGTPNPVECTGPDGPYSLPDITLYLTYHQEFCTFSGQTRGSIGEVDDGTNNTGVAPAGDYDFTLTYLGGKRWQSEIQNIRNKNAGYLYPRCYWELECRNVLGIGSGFFSRFFVEVASGTAGGVVRDGHTFVPYNAGWLHTGSYSTSPVLLEYQYDPCLTGTPVVFATIVE